MAVDSSSSDEDDEEHNAALRSVVIDSQAVLQFATPSTSTSGRKSRFSKSSKKRASTDDEDDDGDGSAGLKFYQIRAQDLLHKFLDNSFDESPAEIAVESRDRSESDDVAEDKDYDGEIRLFSSAPVGVILKRPSASKDSHSKVRFLPPRYDSSDEDSSERESRFQAAAIEGSTIKNQAEKLQSEAFTRFLSAEAAAERAVKAEEKRVGQLRQERGEEWLPSITKEMRKEIREETERRKVMSSEGKVGVVASYRI